MKGIKHLVLIFALAAGACGGAQKAASGAANPAEIEQNIEKKCPADKLPIGTPEQKASFTDMIGKVLSGLLTKVDFVNQLVAQNPGSEQAVKCAADQIPESPVPPPAGDQPPPK